MGSDVMAWVRWEEVVVSNHRGRREIHYYVRDAVGGRDLAVVGREKKARYMDYDVPVMFRQALHRICAMAAPADLKWRSRREVIDWLSSLVSDNIPCRPSPVDGYSDDGDAIPASINISKGPCSVKLGHHFEDFSWIGSPWTCRKLRKHYRSFRHNGITISVQDFVYVMGEDNKRLVAYVEDLYEDMRAYNMVVVRWFHKVDEVAIVLPPDTNDREIIFSLCLQDISVKCIDGLAAVLGPQDFDKFQKDERHRCSSWEPYLCRWQIDSDDLKTFDITKVLGYWSQGLLRSMYSCIKLRLNVSTSGSSSDADKRKSNQTCGSLDAEGVHIDARKRTGISIGSRLENHARRTATSTALRKGSGKQKLPQKDMLAPGCQIELLSQDSGIRGCWFRCVILKRHHDNVKVQYHDLQDADGTGNLEEWVTASRIAAPDKLGIRMSGRPMVRPWPLKGICDIGVGKVVDAWWHDGWWEGIIIKKECEGKIQVYFPGEKRVSIFTPENLRTSQEWVDKEWKHLKDRLEIVSLLHSDINLEQFCVSLTSNIHQPQLDPSLERQQCSSHIDLVEMPQSQLIKESSLEKAERALPVFVHDFCLDGLMWNTTRKRTKGRQLLTREVMPCKRQRIDFGYDVSKQSKDKENKNCSTFALPKSLKLVDHENCKSSGDPLFGTPIAFCSSLVMTR